jgi:amino acid transporter
MKLSGAQLWGAVIISTMVAFCFIFALYYAYEKGDQNNIIALVQAIIVQFTIVVGFWVGSSAGSRGKDAMLAASTPTTVTTTTPGEVTPTTTTTTTPSAAP